MHTRHPTFPNGGVDEDEEGTEVGVEIGLITSSRFFQRSSVVTAWFILRNARGLRELTLRGVPGVFTSEVSSVVESFDVSRSNLAFDWSFVWFFRFLWYGVKGRMGPV